ncbi:MAG: ROK family protein [Lachnospiraceae bacterium]|nr:ROK family protein [Lachnospiraceae bacterium]
MTMEKKYKIGIDLGGTGIKVGVVDREYNILGKHAVPTVVEKGAKGIIADMAGAVKHVLSELGIQEEECVGIGIGSPGMVDSTNGVVVFAGNLDWEHENIAKLLGEHFDLPIKLSNDANCATLGEAVAGAAKGLKNVVLITLGTGVGSGIVINGKIFEGGHAGATEAGHTLLVADGEQCTCGRKGCFEAYCSATALIRDTKRAAKLHPESVINKLVNGDLDKVNGKVPFDAALEGDEVAKEVLANYERYLGEGIVNLIDVFRPDSFLVSGGICNQKNVLLDPVNEFVKKNCFAGDRGFVPEVKVATLGNDAGMIGAAALND